jgi:hypothetical protein
MIVYFDTVRRKRTVREGGELIQLDWPSKKIINKLPIFPTDPDIENDPNPRGNSRGGKGIIISNSELFVGSYHTILVFDLNLNLKRRITNNLFVNIHEMCLEGENVWVSATAIDGAVLVNQKGRTIKSWWPREEPLLQKKFDLFPIDIDKGIDNRMLYLYAELGLKKSHTHLNCVTSYGGCIFVLLNRLGTIIQIEPDIKIVVEHNKIRGSHSAKINEGGDQIILCDSFNKSILFFDLENGNLIKEIELLDFEEINNLYQEYPDQLYNKSIFVRGLEVIDSNRVLVGISPASILEIDVRKNKLLDFYQYSFDVGDAVHGLVHSRGI